jgi:dTDP-4-dehydrorhamnose reductase
MKKFLLFGSSGQLGTALRSTLPGLGEVIACDRSVIDLSQINQLEKLIETIQPTHIINASAYTAVDLAESEPELAHRINALAPASMAKLASKINARFIHYSTDYVFDGSKGSPYLESDPTAPLNQYGESKALGERAIQESGCQHLILRTSWVYSSTGKNFLKTMLKLAQTHSEIKVVNDQIGAPTSADFLAQITQQIISTLGDQSGIYHLTPTGHTSWHGFAQAILANHSVNLLPIPTEAYPTPAKRPLNSRLSTDKICKAFDLTLKHWQVYLDEELSKYETHSACP